MLHLCLIRGESVSVTLEDRKIAVEVVLAKSDLI